MILPPTCARPFAALLLGAVLLGPAAANPSDPLALPPEPHPPAAAASPEPHAPAAAPPPVAAAPVTPVTTTGPAGTGKPAAELNETQQYCQNIAAAAADARFAWQRKQLTELNGQLKQRIADLEAREAALKEALARREEIMKRASDTVLGIYAKMKPEAAAQQLAALEDEAASSILAQLTPKQASSILTEIPAERAAKLIGAITASAAVGRKS